MVDAPATLTLQEWGKSGMDYLVNRQMAVMDAGGGLQPKTVDGEAALRLSYTLPASAKAGQGLRGQNYYVLHRNIECEIDFS